MQYCIVFGHLSRICLASWLIVSSASAGGAGSRIELTKVLNDGTDEYCQYFLEYLRASEPLGDNFYWPQNPDFPDVVFPEWQNLDPQKNTDLLRQIYMREGLGEGREITDDEWQNQHLPKLLASINKWNRQLQASRFDFDNNGQDDTVYRLSYEVHEDTPFRHSFQLAPEGAMAWVYDIAPEERPTLAKAKAGSDGVDYIKLHGESLRISWGYSREFRSLSLGKPYVYRHDLSNRLLYGSKQRCVFRETHNGE